MGFSSEGLCLRWEAGLEDWWSGFCGSPSRAKPFYPWSGRKPAAQGPGNSPTHASFPGPEGRRGPPGLPRNPRLRGGGGVSSLRRNPRKGSESPPRRGYRLRGRPWAPGHPWSRACEDTARRQLSLSANQEEDSHQILNLQTL
ncbi:collagen alpha-1(III) chain-like [Balaenoptera musculus]|uniref:Collagen alpha-1(III) chain-like n=1 Tax=Balaenoptera musculus TaxID=9771 RepID=A0A8B8XDS1_BALMU|nr:collagen alpha-1(III) chain-like [Balaenoptera musculus]